MRPRIIALLIVSLAFAALMAAQTRRRPRTRPPAQTQAPRGSAAKYSAFLHSSDRHKSLACNACHKIPTTWTAKRDFPDVADFPAHDACVRCHRQQFFSRQSMKGTGPATCVVCHPRAAPREDQRFAFGEPNQAKQTEKPKAERQFTIEFPHDKHQNVIAALEKRARQQVKLISASFDRLTPPDTRRSVYDNCAICHAPVTSNPSSTQPGTVEPLVLMPGTFKSRPANHDACFNCHWKNQKPAADDCAGCHKSSATFTNSDWPKRISAKFNHAGGKVEHVLECTTCHINITRAATLRGLTPDVPVAACVACHSDNKKITYPKMVTIQEEFAENKKTGQCTYCHATDVGRKKPPGSHDVAAQ
jgi:Cytochrome c7 and related cytochrome c